MTILDKFALYVALGFLLVFGADRLQRTVRQRLTAWRLRKGWVRDASGTPRPLTVGTLNVQLYQQDEGDETPAPEGLGPRIRARRHSPTTPLAYLEESDWQLWTDVIARAGR